MSIMTCGSKWVKLKCLNLKCLNLKWIQPQPKNLTKKPMSRTLLKKLFACFCAFFGLTSCLFQMEMLMREDTFYIL
jgi:hypothetical protein